MYPYRPSAPFLLLTSAPHTVDLPSPPAFRLPHPRPRTPVGTPTAPNSPAQVRTCLFVASMGVAWTVEVTGYPQGRWEQHPAVTSAKVTSAKVRWLIDAILQLLTLGRNYYCIQAGRVADRQAGASLQTP